MIKIILVAVFLLFGIITYACCMVAHTSDEDAQRMYQEYLERKKRKEKEWEE